ncbi:MAG: alkyldihydroxyacetonephosphate synthase, partial [Solirubrobacteraceae bacterium]|nr:alkyldihydroxyacetonephosphate synthase [Solirubrobacteraceae bacterium]
MARRSVWGWGFEGDELDAETVGGLAAHLGFGRSDVEDPVAPQLAAPRIGIPPELRDCASADDYDRARHGLGSSYMDTVRGLRGTYAHAPDFVVHAWTEDHVQRALEWAVGKGVSVTPVGGGTSVVGGIEAHALGNGAIALVLTA